MTTKSRKMDKFTTKNEEAVVFVFGSLYLSGMLRKYVNN